MEKHYLVSYCYRKNGHTFFSHCIEHWDSMSEENVLALIDHMYEIYEYDISIISITKLDD